MSQKLTSVVKYTTVIRAPRNPTLAPSTLLPTLSRFCRSINIPPPYQAKGEGRLVSSADLNVF